MRYVILQPAKPVDPRTLTFRHQADLHVAMPPMIECESEAEAVAAVRRVVPDGVAMPFKIKIGSGETILLGVVDDPSRQVSAELEIPFALVVQIVAESDHDRTWLRRVGAHVFDRKLWKVPPLKPQIGRSVKIELRATDLEVPTFTEAILGADHQGRSTLYVEVGGIEMSISLTGDETIQIR